MREILAPPPLAHLPGLPQSPPLPHLPGLPRCSQRRKAAADPPRSDPFPTAQWQPVPVREIVAEHLEERQIDFVENILGIMWYLMRIGEALYVG
jgi:hypothetical protein